MGDQSFVSQDTRARVRNFVTPIALGAGRLGLTPNALTVVGFLISGVAAATAAAQMWLVAAGFDPATVKRVTRLIDLAEYKRRQAAPGLKITTKAFGMGRRIPIAQKYRENP